MVPLAWAISLVNDAYNISGIIGKDQKQVVAVLCNLRNDLHNLAEYRLKPLPAIYKQVNVVKFNFFSWIFAGTLGGSVGVDDIGYSCQSKHYSPYG
jgi:hypothetical protein